MQGTKSNIELQKHISDGNTYINIQGDVSQSSINTGDDVSQTANIAQTLQRDNTKKALIRT